ncbi:DUF6894 family protein [Agrobacterium sp. Azo12]|uniref:DUF6894 family protein n=1 Tax=Agrobacterium sp. Azo12 TaxID=3031129 RepID=UPI0023D7CA2B|nr:hypothetical protein [Agrobacterium sp. Azo12]MDO5897270.1 hypothetical protein [Agrobacterium sp. Azo12]
MPTYIFRTIDQNSPTPVEIRHDFPDDDAARLEAKTALGEMAQDGLPINDLHRLAIMVLDEAGAFIVEYRLVLEETSGTRNNPNFRVSTSFNPEIFPAR